MFEENVRCKVTDGSVAQFWLVFQFSTWPKHFQVQSSKKRGYLLEIDLFRIWVIFLALFCWPHIWRKESETSWWWIRFEQRRSNQADLSSHQTMLRQEETMCHENNAKCLGPKNLMNWTCLWLQSYNVCKLLQLCVFSYWKHAISAHMHIFVLIQSLRFGPKESVYCPKRVWLICWMKA